MGDLAISIKSSDSTRRLGENAHIILLIMIVITVEALRVDWFAGFANLSIIAIR